MKRTLAIVSLAFLAGCAFAPDNPDSELVMAPGMVIEAINKQGTLRIEYVGKYTRRYSWDGHVKTFRYMPRQDRWYGSLGMYRPYGDGSMHAVLEEGQQHFSSAREAYAWLAKEERFMEYVWTNDGVAVGWKQQARPKDGTLALTVEVWQIFVNGKRVVLKGSSPSKIRIFSAAPEQEGSGTGIPPASRP